MGEQIRGHQVKSQFNRRCDWEGCSQGPIKFGYLINTGPCQGFFCGPRHYHLARERKEKLENESKVNG